MKRLAHGLTCLLAVFAAGCGIKGSWQLVRAVPNADTFALQNATFEDEAFNATLTIEGRTRPQSGTYKFTGQRLRLHLEDGGMHDFDANVAYGELIVRHGEYKAILRKK